jgi:hypothetical protein
MLINVFRLPEEFAVEFSTTELASQSPTAFFDGVSSVLDALHTLDANLVSFILPSAQAVQRVEQVSIGSLKLKLASLIEGIPEEDIRGLDWQKICGHFLVEGRKTVLRWLRKQPKVSTPEQVDELARELEALCLEAKGPPRRFSRRLLLSLVVRVIRGTQSIPDGETVTVTLDQEKIVLPREAQVLTNVATVVAEQELEPFEQEMRLLVKKPDMIGKSKWDFIDRGHVINAKMSDSIWVERYQNKAFALSPGDAIDAKVRLTPKQDTSASEYSYEIVEVRGVVRSTVVQQPLLFDASPDTGSNVNQ